MGGPCLMSHSMERSAPPASPCPSPASLRSGMLCATGICVRSKTLRGVGDQLAGQSHLVGIARFHCPTPEDSPACRATLFFLILRHAAPGFALASKRTADMGAVREHSRKACRACAPPQHSTWPPHGWARRCVFRRPSIGFTTLSGRVSSRRIVAEIPTKLLRLPGSAGRASLAAPVNGGDGSHAAQLVDDFEICFDDWSGR